LKGETLMVYLVLWVTASASDGSVHLWCCGNQQIVAAWNNEDASAAQCLALLDDAKYQVVSPAEAQADRANEFETEAKVLFAGLENGKLLGIDVRARELVRCHCLFVAGSGRGLHRLTMMDHFYSGVEYSSDSGRAVVCRDRE
jgi:hypothetical protein